MNDSETLRNLLRLLRETADGLRVLNPGLLKAENVAQTLEKLAESHEAS